MQRPLKYKIENEIKRYLQNKISFANFHDWFISITWNIGNNEPDIVTSNLTGIVQLRMAEFLNGHWTEQEFRNHVLAHLPDGLIEVVDEFQTGSLLQLVDNYSSVSSWEDDWADPRNAMIIS